MPAGGTQAAIESEDSLLAISSISTWELALKESIGGLVLVCEAIVSGASIVTTDAHIHRYPVRVLW